VGIKRTRYEIGRCFSPAEPPPPLLLVNKASRAEPLRVYEPLTLYLRGQTAPILINPIIDTVWLLKGDLQTHIFEDLTTLRQIFASCESLRGQSPSIIDSRERQRIAS
jgi:hypothetical protein